MIAVTGASGLIGSIVAGSLDGDLRLLDVRPKKGVRRLDLRDLRAVERAFDGVEKVVHLGAISSEAPFEEILDHNIRTTYNVYEAARRKGVRRVVFASSNHAIGMYPRAQTIGADAPVRPDTYYGVSKAFGEALSALYADKHGLRVLAIRIGNVDDRPVDKRRLSIWIHPEDLVQLVRIGLEHPALHYEVVYGASDNERSWWDNEAAFRLGYRPRWRAEDYRDQALDAERGRPADPVGDLMQGGPFASDEFSGDIGRL